MEFFDTSHGKNPCNEVGGTIKKLPPDASFQCPFSNQILAPKQLFDFPEVNVDGITLFCVSSEEVVSNTIVTRNNIAWKLVAIVYVIARLLH